MTTLPEVRCEGCGAVIDPDTCGCGEPIKGLPHDNHHPIPAGCNCFRDALDKNTENN